MPCRTRNRLSRKGEEGQTLVEFALVLPLLALLLFGVVQFGVAFNQYLTVTDAARAGARKGAVSLHGKTHPKTAAEAAARASATNLDQSKFKATATASPGWEKGADITLTASYPYQISLLGVVVKKGALTSTTTERIE